MYNKIEHKLERSFDKIKVGDTLETLLFNTEELDDIYRPAIVTKAGEQSIEIQGINSVESVDIPNFRYSHAFLQGNLRFKHVEHAMHLKEGDTLMWLGQEYMENGCKYHVGQRFQVLSIERNDNLSKISVITYGRVIPFDWKVINEMLVNSKIVLIKDSTKGDDNIA